MAGGQTSVRPVTGASAFADLAREWDALVDDAEAPVSMRSAAVAAYARSRSDRDLLAVTVVRRDRLVAAVPLLTGPRRGRLLAEKAGVPGEPFRPLTLDPDAVAPLAAGLLDTLRAGGPRWALHLADLPVDDAVASTVETGARVGVRLPTTLTPCLDVGACRPRAHVLSRNVRSADQRARNKAARLGHHLELTWHTDPGTLEGLLPEVVDLHIRRNEQLRDAALLTRPDQRRLYEETYRGHARAGRVRLLTTRVDGRLAAFAACLVGHRRLWAWSNYADPAWLDLSPGTITNAEVVRAAHADPDLDVLDWGAGVQRYKLSGGASLVRAEELRAWSSPLGAARWRAGRLLRRPASSAD